MEHILHSKVMKHLEAQPTVQISEDGILWEPAYSDTQLPS